MSELTPHTLIGPSLDKLVQRVCDKHRALDSEAAKLEAELITAQQSHLAMKRIIECVMNRTKACREENRALQDKLEASDDNLGGDSDQATEELLRDTEVELELSGGMDEETETLAWQQVEWLVVEVAKAKADGRLEAKNKAGAEEINSGVKSLEKSRRHLTEVGVDCVMQHHRKGYLTAQLEQQIESITHHESKEEHSREINFEEFDRTPQDDTSGEDFRNNSSPEPDDLFTSDDPLGLRAKYSYDPKLPREVISGTGSITPSYAEHSPTDHVFGKFPDLHESVLSRVTTPETAARLLLAFTIQAQQTLAQYSQFGSDNPKLPQNLAQQCLAASKQWEPAEFHCVFRWLFTTRALWMRAHALAPLVFAQSKALAYVLREGLQLQIIAERIIQIGGFPDSTVSPEYLGGLVAQSKEFTAVLEWALSCLAEWSSFSSRHFNKMRGAFLHDRPPATLTETAALCQGTLKFLDEAIKLRESLIRRLKRKLQGLEDYTIPNDRTFPSFYYTFGAPDADDIEPPDLRGNLTQLQKALASSTLRDNVKELPTPPPALISTPIRNSAPTTPVAATTDAPLQNSDVSAAGRTASVECSAPTAEPAPPTAESLTGRILETAPAASPPRPRPRMGPPPSCETRLPTNEAAAVGGDTVVQEPRGTPTPAETPAIEPPVIEPPAIEPPAIGLGSKRKRDPNSPKGSRRTPMRIYGQVKAREDIQTQDPAAGGW